MERVNVKKEEAQILEEPPQLLLEGVNIKKEKVQILKEAAYLVRERIL